PLATPRAVFGRRPPRVLGLESLGRDRRDADREGLGRRRLLARHVALRDRALLDRKEGATRVALEDEQVADLGDDGDGVAGPAAAPARDERRLPGDVGTPP